MSYRVIVWGTGAVGREMLTTIIDHRHAMEIVGARVYSADKHGLDVGVLVRRDPIGVVATTAFLFHPRRLSPADRDRLTAACHAGNSSVHGSGLNPGNLSGVVTAGVVGNEPNHR